MPAADAVGPVAAVAPVAALARASWVATAAALPGVSQPRFHLLLLLLLGLREDSKDVV